MSTPKIPPFIVLYGSASIQDKLNLVNQIDKSLGKEDWFKFLNQKPDVIPSTESVVILNDVKAYLNFEFNVQGGVYDVIMRILSPSADSDSGFYVLDSMPEPICWQVALGKGATNYYIQSLYLIRNTALIPGIHNISLFYREPMGLVDMIVQNTKTSEVIILKAVDVFNSRKNSPIMFKINKFAVCGQDKKSESASAYTLPTSSSIVVETPNPQAVQQSFIVKTFSPSESKSPVLIEQTLPPSETIPPVFQEQTFSPANLLQTSPVIPLPPVLQEQTPPPANVVQTPPPIINVPQQEPNMALIQSQTLPPFQSVVTPPPIVLPPAPTESPLAQRQLQAVPQTQGPATLPIPLYVASGAYQSYESNSYYVLVFSGNGSIKFNKPIQVSIIAVAGGGGGAGGDSVVVDQFQRLRILGASGGEGGANIMCSMNVQQAVQYDVIVGQKGISGAPKSAGANGGDTRLSVGIVNYIVCRGGAGGGNTNQLLSSYTVDTAYISNIQAGSVGQNITGQGGKGGVGGYLDQRGGAGLGTVGQDSATYKVPFTNIPAELTNQLSNYYGGGGGGGFCADVNSSGGAGNGQGGGKYDHAIGQSAIMYGGGGGGAIGSNPGGNGGDGVMIFFFPKSENTAISSSLSMTTVTSTQTTKYPVYMTTTISPLPFSGMVVWLVASTMVTATTNTNWKNNAPSATSDASNIGKLLSNAYNATIFNGSPGLNLAAGNAIYTVQMPKNNSPTGLTIFVVMRPVANNSTYVGLVSRNTNKYPAPFDMFNNQRAIGDGSTTNYKFITSSVDLKTLALNTNYLFVFRIAVSATKTSTVSEWLNGKPSTLSPNSVPVYGDTSTNFYIGSREDRATLFSGYIGEVVYYNRPLSDVEVASATTYLNSKYKIF